VTEVFDLDRQTNLKENIDDQGKKWEVKQERGRALYFARPNPDRADAVIPKNMQGQWTKVELLKTEIRKYVSESWAKADVAAAKALRTKLAAKETAAIIAAKEKRNAETKDSSEGKRPKAKAREGKRAA